MSISKTRRKPCVTFEATYDLYPQILGLAMIHYPVACVAEHFGLSLSGDFVSQLGQDAQQSYQRMTLKSKNVLRGLPKRILDKDPRIQCDSNDDRCPFVHVVRTLFSYRLPRWNHWQDPAPSHMTNAAWLECAGVFQSTEGNRRMAS